MMNSLSLLFIPLLLSFYLSISLSLHLYSSIFTYFLPSLSITFQSLPSLSLFLSSIPTLCSYSSLFLSSTSSLFICLSSSIFTLSSPPLRHTHVEVLLCLAFKSLLAVLQPLVDDGVGTFAVEPYLAVLLENHRHALPDVVEVEDAQELVCLGVLLGLGWGMKERVVMQEIKMEERIVY